MIIKICYISVNGKEKKKNSKQRPKLPFAGMDTLDGAAAGVDHGPERGVSALVPVVTHAVHVPVGRNSREGNENQERKKEKLFHQKPPMPPGIEPPPGIENPPESPE
jgi:hypothetical protein